MGPNDHNALTRILAHYMRRPSIEQQPKSMVFIAPIPLHIGMGAIEGLSDLWHTPLMGDTRVPIVRECSFITEPLEMVLSGGANPRHCRMGLGLFRVAYAGDRALPILSITSDHFAGWLLQVWSYWTSELKTWPNHFRYLVGQDLLEGLLETQGRAH